MRFHRDQSISLPPCSSVTSPQGSTNGGYGVYLYRFPYTEQLSRSYVEMSPGESSVLDGSTKYLTPSLRITEDLCASICTYCLYCTQTRKSLCTPSGASAGKSRRGSNHSNKTSLNFLNHCACAGFLNLSELILESFYLF